MNKMYKTIFSFVVVGVLVIGGLVYLSNLTERKESQNKFSDFYEQEENYDVLFFGSSHTLNAVFPMELWKDYGIVSYNMATHGGRTAGNYWLLKNALEYTCPKLVVVDCYMISMNEKVSEPEKIHMATDHIPFSMTKVEMILDLAEGKGKYWDYLWEFSTYHNRWSDLKQEDFEESFSVEKGAESRIAVSAPDESVRIDVEQKIEEETLGIEYLRRIIEECQKQGIEVLLTYLPFPDRDSWQRESNTVWDIAEEYNVNYLDYHTLKSQVNFNTDCYDANSHLNPSGARKITEFIGEYISSTYAIKDHRENGAYEEWHEDYKLYTQFKHDNIKNANDIKNYLMLLRDRNLSYGIYLREGVNIKNYPIIEELLLNINVEATQMIEEGKCFVFVDNINKTRKMITISERMDTPFGEISLIYNEAGGLELVSINGNSMDITLADMGVIVFENNTLSMVNQAKFIEDIYNFNMKKQ